MSPFLRYLKKKVRAVRAILDAWRGDGGEGPTATLTSGDGAEGPTATLTSGDGAEGHTATLTSGDGAEDPTVALTSGPGEDAEREDRPPSYHEQDPAPWPAAQLAAQPAPNRGNSGGDAPSYALRVTNASETEVSEIRAASRAATFESDEEDPDVRAASRTATMGDDDEADEL